MGALIGVGALRNETFEVGSYPKGGTYWKEGAKPNYYSISES